ncbi:MAG: CPBP family intramembrane glutamic endopeptidase [Candidatus Micrarchaeota archaeon]
MFEIGTLLFYAFLVVFTFLVAKALPFSKNLAKPKLREKHKSWKSVLSFLGLTYKKGQWKQIVFDTLSLFFLIIFFLTIESVILSVFNLDDSAKVAVSISQFSLLAIIVAATLGPFAEELFFRGLLQKYLGVFITAVIFAVLHYSFGSVTEIIGAFTAGAILGYWVKCRNSNLWPVIFAHSLYNLVSILMVVVK